MKLRKNLFALVTTVLMILLIASPVWANRTTMCRVTYANSGGHVSCDYFRKNAVTVKKEQPFACLNIRKRDIKLIGSLT